MKKILITIIVLLVFGGAYWYSSNKSKTPPQNTEDENRVIPGQGDDQNSEGDLTGETFSGKLEEVNTGCFADGECYITVDNKHVTVIMGWSQKTVGSVLGVEGFGDLESHTGEDIEVYAHAQTDGTYTLYGNKDFYVKLK